MALYFPGMTNKPGPVKSLWSGKPLFKDENLLGQEWLGDMPVSLSKSTKRGCRSYECSSVDIVHAWHGKALDSISSTTQTRSG